MLLPPGQKRHACERVFRELTEDYGGMTAYSRLERRFGQEALVVRAHPVEGL
ncbi:MAG: hypothetical protein ACT4P4_14455 [Betaproteobacteria bacterium]